MCFPEKDENWRLKITKGVYINIGIVLFETLYLPKLNKEKIEKFVEYKNYDLVTSGLEKGKGVFLLSAHLANWELLAYLYPKLFNGRLNVIVKIQSNSLVNRKVNELRENSGNQMIEIGSTLRKVFELIKKNEIICFLMDQSANPDYSIYAEFFGIKTTTFAGPFKIALKSGTELLFAYMYRNENYKYFFSTERIDISDIKGGDTFENIQLLTERFNKRLENIIREHPDQWLWFHRRFKHIKV